MEEVRSLLKYYSSSFSLDDLTTRLANELLDHVYPLMKENLVSIFNLGLLLRLTSFCPMRCAHCLKIAGLRDTLRKNNQRMRSLIDTICERKSPHSVL